MKLMRLGFLAALGTLCLLALGSTPFAQTPPGAAQAELFTGQGVGSGVVSLRTEGTKVRVRAELRNLPPGFHGFHVHAVGSCQAPTFTSAGGHLNPTGAPHPSHEGDMPVLLVRADGSASINFTTDRFRLADLFDADGSAIIVHANPDNYANIPADRYDPDPDAATLATGDAGGRIACGTLETLTRCEISVRPNALRAGERATLQASIVRQRDELLSSRVRLRGPGIARTVFASGGRMSVTVRPRRAGRLTLSVAGDLRTLGCRATRPVLPRKPPPPPPAVSG